MENRYLGSSGLRVSRFGLGTMGFGGDSDEKTSDSILAVALERGINLVDTANIYQGGETEVILGRILRGRRNKIILCSKAYFPVGPGPNDRGLSRYHILQSVDSILQRLRTDWLDIFYAHHFDPQVDLDELALTFDMLVRSGKVREVGVSNFSAWHTMKLICRQRHSGLVKCSVWQPMYSFLKRQAENEIFECAMSEKVGIVTYSPLAGGLLTGKYHKGNSSNDVDSVQDRFRLNANSRYRERYSGEVLQTSASRFLEYCNAHDLDPVHVALAWANSHEAVACTLLGARTPEQLEHQLGALEMRMTQDLRKEITGLSGVTMSATDRSEEKA